jgi:hypothetical protein
MFGARWLPRPSSPWQPAHREENVFWPDITPTDFASDFTLFEATCALTAADANAKTAIICNRDRMVSAPTSRLTNPFFHLVKTRRLF